MDNNKQSLAADATNPTAIPPVASTPSATPTPTPNVNQTVNVMPPSPTGEQPKSSKKRILMLVLGLVIVVLLIGGAYLFVNSKKSEPQTATTQTQAPDTLESDLTAVDVGSLDTEFVTVNQDLQTL